MKGREEGAVGVDSRWEVRGAREDVEFDGKRVGLGRALNDGHWREER